jgi:hypothetical protein
MNLESIYDTRGGVTQVRTHELYLQDTSGYLTVRTPVPVLLVMSQTFMHFFVGVPPSSTGLLCSISALNSRNLGPKKFIFQAGFLSAITRTAILSGLFMEIVRSRSSLGNWKLACLKTTTESWGTATCSPWHTRIVGSLWERDLRSDGISIRSVICMHWVRE